MAVEFTIRNQRHKPVPHPVPARLQAVADYAQSKGLVAQEAFLTVFGHRDEFTTPGFGPHPPVVNPESWSTMYWLILVDPASQTAGKGKNRVNKLQLSASVYFTPGGECEDLKAEALNAEVSVHGKKLFDGAIAVSEAAAKIDMFLAYADTFRKVNKFRRDFFGLKV